MRDITLRQAQPTGAAPLSASLITPEKTVRLTPSRKRLVSLIEKTIEIVSSSSNWAYQKMSPGQEALVIEPASHIFEEKISKPKPAHGSRRKAVTGTIKKQGTRVKRSLSTPIGKLAAVQAVAMVALFSYVSFNHGTGTSTTGYKDVGETARASQLQKYLPSVPQYIEPKAFTESDAKATDSHLALYSWATPWNLDTLAKHPEKYASLSAFWLTVGPDGSRVESKADWSSWQKYLASSRKAGETYYLTVTGDPDLTYLALSNPEIQTKHIAALLKAVQDNGFDGIDIDYEALGSENRDLFSSFIKNLAAAFHAQNKQVAVTVEARLNNQVPMDWHTLSGISDEMRVMVYDYHGKNTGTPGSIAPIGWLKEVLDYAQSTIDSSKLIVGLGNYGYDWARTDKDGSTTWSGTGVSFDQAMALSVENKTPVIRSTGIDDRGYDIGSAPNFTYKDGNGQEHSVWFEDKASLDLKLQLIKQYKVRGVIFWSVGLGDQAFWDSQNTAS